MRPLRFSSRPYAAIVLMLLLSNTSRAYAEDSSSPRFKLATATIEPAAAGNGRFAIDGRFALEAKVGELRESDHYTVIGRIAAPAVNCAGNTIFANGFE